MRNNLPFETIIFSEDLSSLIIVDQRLLPNTIEYLELKTPKNVWEAINVLAVRGAPAIGVAAGYGMYLGSKSISYSDFEQFYSELSSIGEYLISSRPTAVNLAWAVQRILVKAKTFANLDFDSILDEILKEAHLIRNEDIEMCKKIGEYGLSLLEPKMSLLTHCNAGQLATVRYGTATAPMYLGLEKGYDFKIFADETRPLLQGARLTSFELNYAGMDVTVLCDNMAATLIKSGEIDAILTGADRVCANGDSANKIGTLGLAILAKHYNIPFYICAPSSTIDFDCPCGNDIIIEQRDEKEVSTTWYQQPMVAPGIKCFNPAFDVTDNELITAIITDRGIAKPPFSHSLQNLFD